MTTYDLTIVGLGSGGIMAAHVGSNLGLRMAAVERERPGGDCLWTGCVPSKSLLASAKAAHRVRRAGTYGITVGDVEVDTASVFNRVHKVREEISETEDSPERLREMGVEIYTGSARLGGPNVVVVNGSETVRSKYILICTGSHPDVPPHLGEDCLTNEAVFDLEKVPRSLVVVGGGAIGVEMAQAFCRLGTDVTLLEAAERLLVSEEPGLVAQLRHVLECEGVKVHTGATVSQVKESVGGKAITVKMKSSEFVLDAEAVLAAAGRRSNTAGLGLEETGVGVGEAGIAVDHSFRTSVPSIYAAGDVIGQEQFTHAAAFQATRALRDMFFPGRTKKRPLIPWTTFTDPELAHAGLTTQEAIETHGEHVQVYRRSLSQVDRARADGIVAGEVVLVAVKGRIVGGHILAPAAGELIGQVQMGIEAKMKITKFATQVRTYPTLSNALGHAASDAGYEHLRKLRWLMRR